MGLLFLNLKLLNTQIQCSKCQQLPMTTQVDIVLDNMILIVIIIEYYFLIVGNTV